MKVKFLIVFLVVCFGLQAKTNPNQKTSFVLKITNIKKLEGKLLIAIYDKKEGFMIKKEAIATRELPVNGNTITCKFDNLRKGKYAVALLQDLDGDEAVDKNMLGIPTEPFGFSNNPRIIFKAPSFEDCAFELDESRVVEIKL